MTEIMQIFEDKKYTYDMVYNILRRLKVDSIYLDKTRKKWFIKSSVDTQ
jgi:hypothetical protein